MNARNRVVTVLLLGVVGVGRGRVAAAEPAVGGRLTATLAGGVLLTTSSYSQSISFEQYSELGTLTSTFSAAHRPVVDAGIAYQLVRGFTVGVGFSPLHDPGPAQVSALVPNPLEFGQPRQVSGPAAAAHTELGIHFQAGYSLGVGPKMQLYISGGPSIFHVTQGFVSDVSYTQTFPYDTATYESADVVTMHKTVAGVNVGGDLGRALTPHIELAGGLRYSWASADFAGTSSESVRLGGLHVGGGIRFRF